MLSDQRASTFDDVGNEANRQVLESIFEGGFKSPEFEYDLRSEDFVAEIPQSGEVFDRDTLVEMQRQFAEAPGVEVRRIVGEQDLWVVETVQTYDGEPFHTVVIVEFRDGLIVRETRYYGKPFTAEREA